MRRHPVYESWNLGSSAALPQRTYLYHMRPLGIGSMLVESMTGYIARLAEAHDVSPAMLLNRELLPRMASLSGLQDIPKNLTFLYQSHVLNGASEHAQNCVQVLEHLTDVKNLRALTLLALNGVLSTQHCLRTRRAWCRSCFEDWRVIGRPAYEPLLWAIESVASCPTHQCALSVKCPHCGRALYTLSARSRPGFCWRCQQWLGQHTAPVRESIDTPPRLAFAQGVVELLAAGTGIESFSSVLFKTNLRSCIGSLTDGNVKRFCTATGMTYDSATHWLSVNGRIRLDLLIDLCTQLDLSPLRFLTEPLAEKDFEHGRGLIHRKTSHIKTMRARVRLDEQLAGALNAEPPVSMHAVAAQLAYSSAASLRRRNPDICDQISDRYRRATIRTQAAPLTAVPSNGVIKRALRRALAHTPRVPLKTVARNLGFKNVVALYNRFPQLCRAFAVANREEREQRLAPMRAAIEASLTEWPPPTVRDLTSRFGCTEAALKYRFPDLYSAALTRLPERKQFFDEQTIVLMQRASKEEPAPPVRTVAARTGRSAHCLRVLHADLFKTIKTRHHARRKVDAANLRTAFRTEIASAIGDLLQRGIKPSRHRVFAAILHPSMRNSHIVDQQIIASLREKEASPEKFAGGKC